MYYIIEAIFVGLYTIILYVILSNLLELNIYLELFIIGFLKHLLGFYIGIQEYYCNNGNACNNNNKYYIKNNDLFIQSIIEGILFILIGNILLLFFINKSDKNYKYYLYFFISFIFHIISEFIEYHKYFCNNYCIVKK